MGLFGHSYKKNSVDVPNEVNTETADDEKYVLRTAEEALKITEAKRKEIKERQEEERRKKLSEFPNSDEFKRLMRCINTRISFGDDNIIVHGYDYFILKPFFEPYGYVVKKIEGTGTLISWSKDDTDDIIDSYNFLKHTG
nr:MAG TPA: hypothetical protein [Caudoviricetes sp.]